MGMYGPSFSMLQPFSAGLEHLFTVYSDQNLPQGRTLRDSLLRRTTSGFLIYGQPVSPLKCFKLNLDMITIFKKNRVMT